MNINKVLVLVTATASLTAGAQVTLNDKNANAYDLGYGVEISDFFNTAAATTITGEELQQTSATNLAQALYGRLPALTALSQGGFSGGNLSVDYYNNCYDVAGDNALYPRLTTQTSNNNSHASDIWYKKVHFLKMRNCELYYKVPSRVLSKLWLSDAKVFVQGENLLSFDNVDAMDAEVLSTEYPVFKGVNVGVTLTF